MSRKPSQSNPLEQRQSATSDVLSLTEVASNGREQMFRTEIVRLEALNMAQAQTIAKVLESLDNKDAEIVHLKRMLTGTTPIIGIPNLMASDEEAIIEIQIRKLKESTQNRQMTLDEVKQLDLLIKNKRVVQADAKPKDQSSLPRDVTPGQLLEIASTKIKPE